MKKTAEIEQYKKLVEYLTWLEPEPLEELLQDYEFDVTKNISYSAIDIRPALTIPLAYDWYIDYPRPWADRELGEDLHERNEKVKRLLEGMYTINFGNYIQVGTNLKNRKSLPLIQQRFFVIDRLQLYFQL